MSDITVVSVTTGPPIQSYYTYPHFFVSLQRWGCEPLMLNAVQGVNWSGLGSKPKILYKAIKDGLIKTKNILFTDCWDVVFSHSPERIIAKSEYIYNSPLVISAEKTCFPDDLRSEYDKLDIPGPYKYLNSGMIVGETEALLAVLEAMELHNVPEDYRNPDGSMTHINDQKLFQDIFLKQPVEILLDYKQLLSQTMHEVKLDELDFSQEFIQNKQTKSFPCSFHFNGGSKTSGVREPILQHLGL